MFRKKTFFTKRGTGVGEQQQQQQQQDRGQQQQQQQQREPKSLEAMKEMCDEESRIDAEFGFERLESGPAQLGWLTNMQQTLIRDPESGVLRSAIDYYFLREDLSSFRAAVPYSPYFYLAVPDERFKDIEVELRKTFDRFVHDVEAVQKIDLEEKNHLSGKRRTLMKVSFLTVQALMAVRAELSPIVSRNKEWAESTARQFEGKQQQEQQLAAQAAQGTFFGLISDMREFDVPFYIRTSIDADVRVANWYRVEFHEGVASITIDPELATKRPQPRVLAFDIETTKMPLKFPDPASDTVMMISYMCDKRGYLIVNREVVAEDTTDFEYTPKPEFPGLFRVTNVPDEAALLRAFFAHVKELRPHLFVTYNGDFFDWPFIDARAQAHGLSMAKELGVRPSQKKDYYASRFAPHMDCFCWVQRDSYLPHGSQGLKAVTKAKLGYDPLELDPEDMVRLAREQPRKLTDYSVSDAVATYYLYMQHIHPFVFSLCTIIPMGPDDVLRKGTGTLCENLLMVEAFKAGIVYPNKSTSRDRKMHRGHLLDSETYVGGHVESLESGVFRSDIPMKFKLERAALQELHDNVGEVLDFAIEEAKIARDKVTNLDALRRDICAQLAVLRDVGAAPDGLSRREEKPLIVHVDVAAMYPNIILTNRLQPCAVVNPEICAACLYNRPENRCKRSMRWVWRGDYVPASRSEYELIRAQIESEKFAAGGGKAVGYFELQPKQQLEKLVARLKDYSRKVYKRTHVTEEAEREDTICMRENSFYVDTVRAFRDRRYTYKDLLKTWKGNSDAAAKSGDAAKREEAEKMCVMYDSLQLAHKCILNSFYGYVMRKGSRWTSMQMAGIVTHTGLNIITKTRETIQRIGRPLELDTDGIWCALPQSFPFNFKFALEGGKQVAFSYPCVMLNRAVALNFSNDQYQVLRADGSYDVKAECSIAFELDGPYRMILLPAAKEKDKKLKKRYAVFHMNGTLAEMKGFEVKRRGELKLLKVFQSEVFSQFLNGSTLLECYQSVAATADRWLDVLDTRGSKLEDEELLDLLTESSNMSKKLEAYGTQRTAQVTTAKRLSEFLGEQIVKSEGLKCSYVVANKPFGAMVTERAIPTAIFLTDSVTRRTLLTKWLKFHGTDEELGLRNILDWDYYWKRLESTMQKIVTIPAGLQGIANPIPRIKNPDWLEKQGGTDGKKQTTLDSMFRAASSSSVDMEDIVPDRKRVLGDGEGDDSAMVIDDDDDEKEEEEKKKEEPKAKKQKKKEAKEARQTRLDRVLVPVKDQPTKRVDTFFHRQVQDFIGKPWQIIRICGDEGGVPGEFRVWILADRMVQQITVVVPRRFHVNFTAEPPKGAHPWAERKAAGSVLLPRSRPAGHVEEFKMPESEFLAKQKQLSELMTDPTVEGVYETRVPLILNALISLGCACKVSAAAAKRRHQQLQRWDIDDLEFVNATTVGYLQQPLKKVFLYESQCKRGDATLGVIGVYLVEQKRALIFVANPFLEAALPNVSRIVTDRSPELEVRAARSPSIAQAHRDASAILATLHSEGGGSHVLITQTPLSDRELAEAIPGTAFFAHVPKPCNRGDNRYAAFGWEAEAVRRMHGHFAHVEDWLRGQLALARYAHVPLGNVQEDAAVSLSDVMLARSLQQSRHLLWVSQSDRPDLGGSEEDDNQLCAEEANPEVCEAGCYRNVCVELDMKELALNAILKAESIVEGEGSASVFAFADSVPSTILDADIAKTIQMVRSFDGTIDGIRPFKAVKKLAHRWMKDTAAAAEAPAPTDQGLAAQFFLSHLYRWITCPCSRLHEPAVHRVVAGMMKRLFFQLLFVISKKLGAHVIYANFNRLVICTQKAAIEDAVVYVQFLQSTLESDPLFSSVVLTPKRFWDVLLFMDAHNHGGIPASPDHSTPDDEIISNWNIAEFLPKAVEPYFLALVSSFLLKVCRLKRAGLASRDAPPAASQADAPAASGSTVPSAGDAPMDRYLTGDPETDDEDVLIGSEFSQQLFTIIKDIQRTVPTAETAGESESARTGQPGAGATLPSISPALTFANFVCHVLSLDETSRPAVVQLKKGLLRLVGAKEFTPDAEFRNPCSSYTLPDVICSFCNACKDIDLLRDPNVGKKNWACASCGQPYNKLAIEAMLVRKLKALSLAYQVQDLICGKCHEVKADNVMGTCRSCRATAVRCKDTNPESMQKILSTFSTIASFHSFEWLSEVVEGLSMSHPK